MKQIFIFLELMCKRLCKSYGFLLLLILFPGCVIAMNYIAEKEDTSWNVALYARDEDATSNKILQTLVQESGLLHFYICDSEEELTYRVQNRISECGYIFPENFTILMQEDMLRLIEKKSSDATSFSSYSDEYVISAFMRSYCLYSLEKEIRNNDKFKEISDEEISQELEKLYEKNSENREFFKFDFVDEVNAEHPEGYQIVPSLLLKTSQGLTALFLFLGTLTGGFLCYRDRKNGVFLLFSTPKKRVLELLEFFVPGLFCSVIALGIFAVLEEFTPLLLLRIFAYFIICALFSYLLQKLVPSETIYAVLFPLFVIGSVVFSPVIIDFMAFFPRLAFVKYLFPTTYFLNCNGFSSCFCLLLCGILGIVIIVSPFCKETQKLAASQRRNK